jgi:chromosome segregation ATPase|uniref:Macoilin family n=1 Tax=Siphoviridae sp. ctnhN1 TaxID=2827589 RepID=A0A8S5LKH6_9CAUD|nr:MAG TPA: Macoilin family [Siphoviridae sp. ctnhN1]
MSINIKKYTKDQMAKMVEEAQEKQGAAEAEAAAHFKDGVKLAEENEKLRGEIGTLTERLDQMTGEVINKANEIANLKADLDTLRNKLADTEAALGRANAEVSRMTVGCRQVEEERDYMHQQWSNAEQRANYAESHPWRNLWVWVKRKVARHE